MDWMDYVWQRKLHPLLVGLHTIEICERIDKAIDDYRNGKSSYLCIQVPVRHGKSDIVSRYLPPRFLGLFPDDEVIVAGYTASLAWSFSRFARNVMRDPRYREVFPGVKLSREEQSVDAWGIEGRLSKAWWVGLDGSITGKGANLAIIDDFFKGRKEAESKLIRDNVWSNITDDILTRMAPVAICIILATPWHIDDPFGRITKAMQEDPKFPRFEFLRFPGKGSQYESGYLFPERFTADWYEARIATLGPYSAAGLIYCSPIPQGGNKFAVDKINWIQPEDLPRDIQYTRGWDLASTKAQTVDKEDPDYTVGVKVGIKWEVLADGEKIPRIYIADMIRGRWRAPERDKLIKASAIGDGAITVGVEAYGPYKDSYEAISKALFGIRVVKRIQLPGDKMTKWEPLEAAMAAGNVYVVDAPWKADFLDEMGTIPGALHDDIADAIIAAYAAHSPTQTHVWPHYDGRRTGFQVAWPRLTITSTLVISQWVDSDFRTSILLALWNAELMQLWVFDELVLSTYMPEIVVPSIVNKIQTLSNRYMKDASAFEWYGSPSMFSAVTDSARGVYNKDGMWRGYDKAGIRIMDNPQYDEYGAVLLVSRLISSMVRVKDKMISSLLVHNRCQETATQMAGWVVDKGRPSTDGFGLCRALCNMASKLWESGKMVKHETKLMPYSREKEIVMASMDDADRAGMLGDWVANRATMNTPVPQDPNAWMTGG
jgi:predicted phage terminase large subunit-like protein